MNTDTWTRYTFRVAFDTDAATDNDAHRHMMAMVGNAGLRVECDVIPDGSVVVDRARFERLRRAVDHALNRYDNPREPHNAKGGFPRGDIAWAMASDLRDDLQSGDLDPIE